MQQQPFSYHKEVRNYFKEQQKTWNWFQNSSVQEKQIKEIKEDILKNTYRLTKPDHDHIFALVEEAKKKLSIENEIFLYQELQQPIPNASVCILEQEVHIVFSGDILNRLSKKELLAVIAHELGHVLFFQIEDRDFENTNRIIHSIANDRSSSQTMIETARLFRLHTELYCDKVALEVVGDVKTVIESLVKASSSLVEVDGKEYLKQANEILSQDKDGSTNLTHPETYIRAKALDIHKKESGEEAIQKIMNNNWGLSRLDLFKQKKLHQLTKEFLELITKPSWIRTDFVFNVCRQYFYDFKYNDERILGDEFHEVLDEADDSLREYFSYILLDISMCDNSLEGVPLGHCFEIAEYLGIAKTFRQLVKKEKRLTVKVLDKQIKESIKSLAEMSENQNESILKDE